MQQIEKTQRLYFLDNLRTFMIFLVVVLHSALVYETTGTSGFFWIVYDFSSNTFIDDLITILDLFIMAIIFFIAGYFAPKSAQKKSLGMFLRKKVVRLLVPWLVAVLLLIPMYKVIFLASRHLPQQNWLSYFHFNNGIFGQVWLWFLPILFGMETLYALLSRIPIKLPKMAFTTAVFVAMGIAFLTSVGMDMFGHLGWTKTFFFDFQNERLLMYMLMFVLGSIACKQQIFTVKPTLKLRDAVILIFTIPIMLIFSMLQLHKQLYPGEFYFTRFADAVLLWLSSTLATAGFVYLLVRTFHLYANRSGKFLNMLSQNSYGVYIIHTIVMGLLAYSFLQLQNSVLLKFTALFISTFILSNLFVLVYRQKLTAIFIKK